MEEVREAVPLALARTAWAAAAAAGALALAPVPPASAAWAPAEHQGTVEPADIRGVEAKREVIDPQGRVGARAAQALPAPVRVESFTDDHGHTVTLGTDHPDVDLGLVATIVTAGIHGDELSEVRIRVVRLADIAAICGGGVGVVACYGADDADREFTGEMIVAADDSDLVHTVIHEYGHHVDNQLMNLGHLGLCSFDRDGSRNWFFTRELDDEILDSGFGCSDDTEWEYLLGELYAEDYVWLSGIRNWQLHSASSPTEEATSAIEGDMLEPFDTRRVRAARRVRHRRGMTVPFEVENWTFATLRLYGPRGRDFDLFLYEESARQPFARSVRRGSREVIEQLIAPGTYEAFVFSFRGSGRARVRIALD